jgi:hypothetical protein
MAVIEINLKPTDRDLKWFGVIALVFFGVLGAIAHWRMETITLAAILWILGATLCALYYIVRPLRRPLYLGWMYTFFPIGWVMSHFLLGLIYYVVLTPIGLVMRAIGRDPMQRRLEPDRESYWVRVPRERSTGDPSSYYRQF